MVRIAVIGCGYWGSNLIRTFNGIRNVDIAYCVNIRQERLDHIKKIYPKIKTEKDYKKILDKDIDAIVIATPIMTHYEIAKDVLEANKHVLVEKPMTANSEHALDLIRIAKKNKKVLMVDHTFEYSSSVRKIN